MTTETRAAVEQRGRSTAAAPLDEQQTAYLTAVRAQERDLLVRHGHGLHRALHRRLVHRGVRGTVAERLADAVLIGDERTVAMLLPVYAVVVDADDRSRPAAQLPR